MKFQVFKSSLILFISIMVGIPRAHAITCAEGYFMTAEKDRNRGLKTLPFYLLIVSGEIPTWNFLKYAHKKKIAKILEAAGVIQRDPALRSR